MKITNPANGEVISEVAEDSAADVARKVERARGAQPEWAERGLVERAAAVRPRADT